jgi:hypothetical protein
MVTYLVALLYEYYFDVYVCFRYEAESGDKTTKAKTEPQQQPSSPAASSSPPPAPPPSKGQKDRIGPSFEKSAAALENHLKLMHQQRRPALSTAEAIKVETKRIKLEAQTSDSEDEEQVRAIIWMRIRFLSVLCSLQVELTEWFPPDLDLTHFEKVVVTDVTVDDVTVTMRESQTPDGFFNRRGARGITNSAA